MRYFSGLATAMALLLAVFTPAQAQTSVHVRGGTALPLSPDLFTEASAPGVALEIGPAFVLTNRLRLITTLGHRRFPFNGTSALDGGAMTSWSFSADLQVYLRPETSSIVPYVTVGSSVHRTNNTPEIVIVDFVYAAPSENALSIVHPSYPSIVGSGPEARLGLQAGLGISAQLAPALRLFLQSEYTGLFLGDEDLQYVPIQLGFRFRPFR